MYETRTSGILSRIISNGSKVTASWSRWGMAWQEQVISFNYASHIFCKSRAVTLPTLWATSGMYRERFAFFFFNVFCNNCWNSNSNFSHDIRFSGNLSNKIVTDVTVRSLRRNIPNSSRRNHPTSNRRYRPNSHWRIWQSGDRASW